MDELVRFGVSINETLLHSFDQLIERKGYKNRSEAIRDIIRDVLVNDNIKHDEESFGVITIQYDHHVRGLSSKLTGYQHNFTGNIISTLHVHIDHDNCLEVIVIKGKGSELSELADNIIGIKGVKHGKLLLTSVL